MKPVRFLDDDLAFVGCAEQGPVLFEHLYPSPEGMSYNSFVLKDEQTVVFDTVDASVANAYFSALSAVLGETAPDYLIVHHAEPDHAACVGAMLDRYPNLRVVCSEKCVPMLSRFLHTDVSARARIVGDGDELSTGRHTLRFFSAPMVHWPEVTVTFDRTTGTLFSADAFGAFGAPDAIYADETDFSAELISEYRRYYANIVGKYGASVQALFKKIAPLEIRRIFPLHGLLFRHDFDRILSLYRTWSAYEAEERCAAVFCGTIYGNTASAARILAEKLKDRGIPVRLFDVSTTDVSHLVAEAFRASVLVFASVTYNGGLFPPMRTLLSDLKDHGIKNRGAAVIGNGSWAPAAGELIAKELSEWKNVSLLASPVRFLSSPDAHTVQELDTVADSIAASLSR